MPSEIKTRYISSTRKTNNTPVRPSLFVGLGGSGKEVLMRLRRLFYTNTRTTGLPVCEYLWIDTDPSPRDIDGQDYDDIFSKIDLGQNDVVKANIPPAVVRDYFDRPGKYGHVFEWLHKSIKDLGPNMLEAGAGGIRACGRLAFWHHYADIRMKIVQKLFSINDSVRIRQTQESGFQIDTQIANVYLVGSLAGGTGAGMFIDAAFSLNNIAAETNRTLFITGIFFLPSVFEIQGKLSPGRMANAYSTAYASLMEMDYYNSPVSARALNKNDVYRSFEFKWGGTPHEVYSAPMQTIYLIGSRNSSGIQLHKHSEAFQMAAESIHLEFCQSDFGVKKRSVRVNLQDFLINETLFEQLDSSNRKIYSNYFPNRYSSFGLSFVKLDVDRRRNAAAYYYAKSLADHWRSNNKDAGAVKTAVDNALTIRRDHPDLFLVTEGHLWDKDTLRQEFLVLREQRPEKTSMLDNHMAEVKSHFQKIKDALSAKFERRQEALNDVKDLSDRIAIQPDVSLWEDAPEPMADLQKLTVILKDLHRVWDSKVKGALDDLGGRHKREITANAGMCLKLMKRSFEDEFFALVSKPGEEETKAGISHAEIFCQRYLSKLEDIKSQLVLRAAPPSNFQFTLEPIKPEKAQLILARRRNEARALRAPFYHKSASTLFDSAHQASVDKHLARVRVDLFKSVELQETRLLEWLDDNYWNQICKSTNKIIDEMIRTVGDLKYSLQSYVEGLKELSDLEKGLLDSFNLPIQDIRYCSIDLGNEQDWYRKEILKALQFYYPNAAAMTWEMVLDQETERFINELPEQSRIDGFKHLFQVVHDRKGEIRNWQSFISKLDEFCFTRIHRFLEGTNADVEFQKSNALNKEENLEFAARAADIWISPGQPFGAMEDDKYIGVPSMQYTTTARNIINRSQHLAGSQLISHEKGNLSIYREGTAFPLFHLSELERCRQEYENDSQDLTRLFHRHSDYRHLYKLREIEPPRTEREAIELFEVGVLLLHGVLLGCCDIDESPERQMLRFRLPPSAHRSWSDLGPNFGIAAKSLRQNEEVCRHFRDQKNRRIRTLKDINRHPQIEMLCLAGYYTESVFLTLQRAGHKGITSFDTNMTLICKELRMRLAAEAVRELKFEDLDDPELWKLVDGCKLDEISEVFPFIITDAQAPLRRLKD